MEHWLYPTFLCKTLTILEQADRPGAYPQAIKKNGGGIQQKLQLSIMTMEIWSVYKEIMCSLETEYSTFVYILALISWRVSHCIVNVSAHVCVHKEPRVIRS